MQEKIYLCLCIDIVASDIAEIILTLHIAYMRISADIHARLTRNCWQATAPGHKDTHTRGNVLTHSLGVGDESRTHSNRMSAVLVTSQSEDLHQQISCSLARPPPPSWHSTLLGWEGIQGEVHRSGAGRRAPRQAPTKTDIYTVKQMTPKACSFKFWPNSKQITFKCLSNVISTLQRFSNVI